MRLAETVSAEIKADPQRIWTLVADVTRMGEWSPECYRCEWVDGKGPTVGARFRGHNRMGPMRWSTVSEVVACDPGREFAFVARHWTGAATRWTYRFEPVAGGTRVTESFETEEGPALILGLDRLLQRPRRLKNGMRATLERLGRAAAGD